MSLQPGRQGPALLTGSSPRRQGIKAGAHLEQEPPSTQHRAWGWKSELPSIWDTAERAGNECYHLGAASLPEDPRPWQAASSSPPRAELAALSRELGERGAGFHCASCLPSLLQDRGLVPVCRQETRLQEADSLLQRDTAG